MTHIPVDVSADVPQSISMDKRNTSLINNEHKTVILDNQGMYNYIYVHIVVIMVKVHIVKLVLK